MSVAPDANAIAALFGLGPAHGPLTFVTRGQSNPLGVWRMRCDRGSFAVKCYAQPPRPDAIACEVAAHTAGAQLPRPLSTPTGAHHASIRIGTIEALVRVTEWVDGAAFEWHTVDARVSKRIGALVAAIHRVPPPKMVAETPAKLLISDGWRELAARALQHKLVWAKAALMALPALTAHAELANEARADVQGVLSQRDFHPPNVIAQPNGRLVLVDWDAAGLADANADVAQYAFVWATSASGAADDAAAAAFVRGYIDGGGVLRQPSVSDFAPASANLLSWIEHNARRDLDSASDSDPDLTLALLDGVRAPDRTELERRAALLRAA